MVFSGIKSSSHWLKTLGILLTKVHVVLFWKQSTIFSDFLTHIPALKYFKRLKHIALRGQVQSLISVKLQHHLPALTFRLQVLRKIKCHVFLGKTFSHLMRNSRAIKIFSLLMIMIGMHAWEIEMFTSTWRCWGVGSSSQPLALCRFCGRVLWKN